MSARLIGVDAPEWRALLESRLHDVWVLPTYVALSASYLHGEPAAAYVDDGPAGRLLMPIIVRDLGHGRHDAVSPYGYPGVIADDPEDGPSVARAMKAIVRELAAEGIVSLFLRTHPLFPVQGLGTVGTVVRTETVAVDLSLPEEQIWQGMRKTHRSQVSKGLDELGMEFRMDPSAYAHAEFRRLYRATMGREGAAGFYFFDDEYFDRLQSAFGDHLHLATVRLNGRIAAAGLITESAGIVTAYLTGRDHCDRCRGLAKVLKYSTFMWAKARGNHWYHLGGGRGGEIDGLLEFKSGFSKLRFPYETVRVVVRDEDYRQLLADRHPEVDAGDATGYFPAYRDPAAGAGMRGLGGIV